MIPSYTYYKKEKRPDHRYFAREVAEFFGLFSQKMRPHARLISAVADSMPNKERYEELYYLTRSGATRVYCLDQISEILNHIKGQSIAIGVRHEESGAPLFKATIRGKAYVYYQTKQN